jgi:hypothetical protein
MMRLLREQYRPNSAIRKAIGGTTVDDNCRQAADAVSTGRPRDGDFLETGRQVGQVGQPFGTRRTRAGTLIHFYTISIKGREGRTGKTRLSI